MALLFPSASFQVCKYYRGWGTSSHGTSRIPKRFYPFPCFLLIKGGLLVDTGYLTLKPELVEEGIAAYRANALLPGQPAVEVIPIFPPESDVIVEWRACTVAIIDTLVPDINRALGYAISKFVTNLRIGGSVPLLTLAQILEAGTWKAGRELAEVSRPNTKEPPIGLLASDGTVSLHSLPHEFSSSRCFDSFWYCIDRYLGREGNIFLS